jgi:signal transduction histidine kinase
LFLAVKESLNNVVKHAKATKVSLSVKLTDNGLEMEIADNGQGFAIAPDDALADGLRNLQNRIAAIGGVCTIASQPGLGTTIRFEIPWKAERPDAN